MINMKKRLLKLSILLLLLIPFNVKAATFTQKCFTPSELKSKDYLKTYPTQNFYFSSAAYKVYTKSFCFFQIEDGGYNFVSLCAGIGKHTINNTANMIKRSDLSNIVDVSGNRISAAKVELLQNLLSYGYHYTLNGTEKLSNMTKKVDILNMMAMQIITWEIIEGGRSSFNTVAPNVYNSSNSAYKLLIYKNGGDNPSQSGTLYYYYAKIINDVKASSTGSSAPAFNRSTYTMKWNQSSKKYSVSVSNLGEYTTCKSNNSNVTVSVSGKNATVSTKNSTPQNATITCSYTVGNGFRNESDSFAFYDFPSGVCSNCQKILRGAAIKTYSKSFKVISETSDIKIVKQDYSTGKELSGAKFSLTSYNDKSYSFTLKGNGDAVSVERSGRYIVSETVAPEGYEKVNDFWITLDADYGKITDCEGKGTIGSTISCLNGQVIVMNSDPIYLIIRDVARNFKITKVDENNKALKGATFNIKNESTNKLVKFTFSNNMFKYDDSNGVVDIYSSSLSTYPISLLPDGKYSIIETKAPSPYVISSKESDRTTRIQVSKGSLLVYDASSKKYVKASEGKVTVKNYKTNVTINKIGNGKALEDVVFILFKEDKTTQVKATLTSKGVYDYNVDQSVGTDNDYITNAKGNVTVNNLPSGTYYFKEIQTVDPYVLPEGEDAYIKVVIDVTASGSSVNGSINNHTITFSNTKFSFNFYKIDEDGNYLKNGKFKIQKYDTTKERYVDIKVKSVENDGTYNENADIFEPSNDGKVKFTVENGIATFINMEPSTRYRIIETNAPAGYIRSGSNDSATVTIDKNGNASGLLTIVNQKERSESTDGQAELIVSISTGVDRIKYSIIIGGAILLTIALIVINNKSKKK